MSGPYVRPPSGWEEFQHERQDQRERRDTQIDIMALRAWEGLEHARAVVRYRRWRTVAILVTVLVVGAFTTGILSSWGRPTGGLGYLTGALLLMILVRGWRLVISANPGTVVLTPLPEHAPRHPAFEATGEPAPDMPPAE